MTASGPWCGGVCVVAIAGLFRRVAAAIGLCVPQGTVGDLYPGGGLYLGTMCYLCLVGRCDN